MPTQALNIINEKGLHARASAKFVEVVEGFDANCTVRKDGMDVSGDSIMGLLMLAASRGTSIEVETSGPDAAALMNALVELVANRFGEDFNKGHIGVIDHPDSLPHTDAPAPTPVAKEYDMRRLSYAGTFKNPFKAGTIRAIEWLTAKITLLKAIRDFERTGVPFGVPFWTKAIKHMGIDVQTPADEIALIPKTGALVVVANHPHGLVDGMVMGEILSRVRPDFKILTRSLLTGIPEIEQFMIPVPFPHEDNARELGLQMRNDTMAHLQAGGAIILFPAGKVAMSETFFGPAIEAEWNVFTHKIVQKSKAKILPIYFRGHNSRAFLIANLLSDSLRQGLLLYEIKRALNKPQRPYIGAPLDASELNKWEGNPRGFLAWLRAHTLALGGVKG